jgi:hypothetical protein
MTKLLNRQNLHDIRHIKLLPDGQLRAVVGLIGGDGARTYKEASVIADMSLGTLYTHLRRIRINHPVLHKAIYKERKNQLKVRHREAVGRARDHTRKYFSNVRKGERAIYRWARAEGILP